MSAAVTTDEIYKRYLDKAIREILRLEHEVAEAAAGAPVAQPTGHPLGTIFLRQVRAAGAGAAGGRRVPRPRRARAQAVARAAARRPARGLRHELRQVRRRRRGASAAPGSQRELRIVQPKLVVVMGEDALEFVNGARVPALAAARGYAGRAPAASPRRSRRSSSPTSTSSLDEPAREDTLLERVQARRPLVGRAAALLILARGARRLVRGGAAPAVALGGGRASRSSSLVVMPAMFGARLARAAVWREPPAARRGARPGRALAVVLVGARLAGRLANFAKFAALTLLGWLFLAGVRGALVGRARRVADPVGRRLLGLARADARRSPSTTRHVFARSRSRSSCPGGGAARLGLPDVLFFARVPRRERALRPAARAGRGSGFMIGLGLTMIARDLLDRRRPARAAGDLARLPARRTRTCSGGARPTA